MGERLAPASWPSRSAWEGIIQEGKTMRRGQSGDNAVCIHPGPDRSIELLAIDPRTREDFQTRFRNSVGLSMPRGPQRIANENFELIWAGPDQWLFCCQNESARSRFDEHLQSIVAITDLSDSRAILRISGPGARDVLAKGCMIDLHPRSFKTNDVALTVIAHIGAHIWQIDEVPTYEIAVFRSLAMSFWSWLEQSL